MIKKLFLGLIVFCAICYFSLNVWFKYSTISSKLYQEKESATWTSIESVSEPLRVALNTDLSHGRQADYLVQLLSLTRGQRHTTHLWNSFIYSRIISLFYDESFVSEAVLNLTYLGKCNGKEMRGIVQAAKCYYSKEPKDILPIEAATIIVLSRAPGVYQKNQNVFLIRRNALLEKMLLAGKLKTNEFEQKSPIPASFHL